MYRRVIFIILIAVIALFVATGCNKQEIADLKTQNASKDNIIVSLTSEAANLREGMAQETIKSAALAQGNESLNQIVQVQSAETAQLKKTLTQIQAQAKKDLQEFAEASVIFQNRQVQCTAENDSLRQTLATSTAVTDSITKDLNWYRKHSEDINEWKEYYEQESYRSWWKKLWGAGKHTPPPFPDPTGEEFLSR